MTRIRCLAAGFGLLASAVGQVPFTIVHISDTHVGARTGKPHLEIVLDRIAALRPPPRLVVVTGDLTEKGTTREIELYFDTVGAFERRSGIPVLSAAGNHDVRWTADGRRLLRERGAALPALRVLGDVGVLAVDSTLSFGQHGRVARGRLAGLVELDDELGRVRDLVVAMHHPPGREPHLPGELALLAPVLGKPVSLVLCGHAHRHLVWQVAGVPHAMAIGVMNRSFGWRTIRFDTDTVELSHTTIEGARTATVVDGTFPRADASWPMRYAARRHRVRVRAASVSADADRVRVRRVPGGVPLLEARRTNGERAVADLAELGLPPGLHDLVVDFGDQGPPIPVTAQIHAKGIAMRDLAVTLSTPPLLRPEQQLVVLVSEDGAVFGLDADSLESRWRIAVAAEGFVRPLDLGPAGIAVCDGTPAIVELSLDGEVVARRALPALATAATALDDGAFVLALADGTVMRWRPGAAPAVLAVLPAMTRARPFYFGAGLLVATWDRRIHALAADGAVRGDLLVHRSFYYSASTADPLDLGGRALFFGHDQRLLVVDPDPLQLVEAVELDGVSPAYGGGVVASDGSLVLASMDGSLCVVDRDPWRLRSKIALGGAVFDSTPCVAGSRAWVGTMTGDLVEVDLEHAAVTRRVHLGGYVVADPLLTPDAVYAVSTAGRICRLAR